MASLSQQIAAFQKRTMQQADQSIRKVAIDTLNKLQGKTPVDSGQLRGSWTVSKEQPPTVFNGSDTVIANTKFGDTVFIATDKPYALMLEYGLYPKPGGSKTINGFSIQAPKGMVRITVQEMEALLKRNKGKF